MRSLACLLMTKFEILHLVYLQRFPCSDSVLQKDLEFFSERCQAFFLFIQENEKRPFSRGPFFLYVYFLENVKILDSLSGCFLVSPSLTLLIMFPDKLSYFCVQGESRSP